MKLIEGLKQIKDLRRKADDLKEKISKHSAHASFETPVYSNQGQQVREWLQAYSDILKKILELRIAIQRTNLATQVTIELGGKKVTKSIAEWVHRRRDLATLECEAWKALTDRGIREGQVKGTGGDMVDVRIVRYYDPAERDKMVDQFTSEPVLIDARLEIVNAVTDLIEEF